MSVYQPHLWDEPVEVVNNRPVLMEIQKSLIERGRVPYQQGAKRVIWQAPCGSGKTIVAGQQTLNALAMGKSVLHIVHRRRLVDQMTWTLKKFGINASPIMEGRNSWFSKVNCASRDTLLAMLKAGHSLPRADLIVWDECHVAADNVQKWYLENCPQSFWTGYTATPVYSDGSSMKPPYEALVCMAPTSKMIEMGWLCPVKVFDPKAVGVARKRGDKVKPVGDPVAHWLRLAKDLPTVVFAAKVSDSKDIVEKYLKANITAEHIDASTPEEEREAVYERSRLGVTKVISNVGVMIEGVDLPWLVCCQMLRGCNSLILWVQGPGRVMRAYEGKTHGIVLDHSAASSEFGSPDSDYQWGLDDEGTIARKNKLPKERKLTACIGCGFMFAGKPSCPECGRVLSVKKRKSLMDSIRPGDGVLTEFNGEQGTAINSDRLNRLWKKCLYITRAKGGPMRQAAGMFSREAKIAPWEAGLDSPIPSGKDGWSIPAAEWMRTHS